MEIFSNQQWNIYTIMQVANGVMDLAYINLPY